MSLKFFSALFFLCVSATQTPYDADYDDITTNIALGGQIPSPYKDLKYSGSWLAISYDGTLIIPAVPHSPPQIAIFSSGVNTISTIGDAVMNLDSFYFNCVITDGTSLAAVGTNCDILVTGFSSNGTLIAQETFSYLFGGPGSAQKEVPGLADSFTEINNLTFEIVNTVLSSDLYVVGIDDLMYKVFPTTD